MSVNLSGKSGHNVDMDEYVETYIVRPLKTYATGNCIICIEITLFGSLLEYLVLDDTFTQMYTKFGVTLCIYLALDIPSTSVYSD